MEQDNPLYNEERERRRQALLELFPDGDGEHRLLQMRAEANRICIEAKVPRLPEVSLGDLVLFLGTFAIVAMVVWAVLIHDWPR